MPLVRRPNGEEMNRFAIVAGMAMLTGMSAPSLMAQNSEVAPIEEEKAEAKESTGVAWGEDYAAALKEAKESGKFVIVDFTATW